MLGCKPMISAAGLEQNTAISGPEVKVTPFSKLGAPRVLINPFAKLDPQFEEIQQLRARLAILEKNASIKVEPLGMVTSPVRERVGIKREPLEPEDRRECKRLRSSRYGGFVDLT
ncbi:hypothetical protein MMC11_003589 [Xylographa trunciseda]|nr:hypothetical protein [Xylographa trunciseda]